MCSPATIILVRHAAVDCSSNGFSILCGKHDVALSPVGWLQVDALRRRLAAEPFPTALYSSPLRRALETARAAPRDLFHKMRVLESLAEIDCGAVDGLLIEEVQRKYPEIWLRNSAQLEEDFCWPGGESYRCFRKRVLCAIRAIAQAHPGERVLVVTHAGVVNQVLGAISGQSAARWEVPRPGYASLTTVLWNGDRGCLECFDDRSHLQAP